MRAFFWGHIQSGRSPALGKHVLLGGFIAGLYTYDCGLSPGARSPGDTGWLLIWGDNARDGFPEKFTFAMLPLA